MRFPKVNSLVPLTSGSPGLWDLFSTRGRGVMEGEERKKQTNEQTNPVDFHQKTWGALLAGSPGSVSLIRTRMLLAQNQGLGVNFTQAAHHAGQLLRAGKWTRLTSA